MLEIPLTTTYNATCTTRYMILTDRYMLASALVAIHRRGASSLDIGCLKVCTHRKLDRVMPLACVIPTAHRAKNPNACVQ